MPKKATIYEVAKRVGVSISTVSRVLNESPHVSSKTKQEVLEAMEDLNYRPQLTARKLAKSEPQMLAVAVPSFTTPYYNEVLKGIKDEIQSLDLDLVMYNTGSQFPEKGLQNFFDRGMVDAAIILSIEIPDEVHNLIQATDIPVVLVNSSHPAYDYFRLNDYRGGYLAGEHLARQGFMSIGMILTAQEGPTVKERRRGLMQALMDNNLPVEERFFVRGDSQKHRGFTEESGYEAVQKLKAKGDFPDAIFCSNDTQAIGAMYALSKLGVRVPEDIAIMGYDNIKSSKYRDLTTIDQKMYSIGVEALKRLRQLVEEDPEAGEGLLQKTIDPVLVERGSTKKM